MPFYVPFDVMAARRRRNPVALGQYGNTSKYWFRFKFTDKNGRPIPFQKYYFDFLPSYNYGNDSRLEAHFSRTTDGDGIIEDYLSSITGDNSRLVSVTPLFEDAFAPKDRAIIWQVPMTLNNDQGGKITSIINQPGGGLDAKPAPPVPAPVSPAPAPSVAPGPSPQPGNPPPADQGQPGRFPWELVLLGSAALVAGIILIPMFLDREK